MAVAASVRVMIRQLLTFWLAAAALSQAGEEFGDQLFDARSKGLALPQLSAKTPGSSLEDGYAAPKRLVTRLVASGEQIAGFKGAVAGAGGQKALGIDGPLFALLFQSGWLKAADHPSLKAADLPQVGIETEIGYLLSKAVIEPLKSPEEARAVFRAIVPVIELPAGLRETGQGTTAADLAAVNVMSASYIVGNEVSPEAVNPDAIQVRLLHDGKTVNETSGADANRGQWCNLMQQINLALEQGYRVEPGQLIVTGALGKIHKDVPGDYVATWSGLGEIRFSIH